MDVVNTQNELHYKSLTSSHVLILDNCSHFKTGKEEEEEEGDEMEKQTTN